MLPIATPPREGAPGGLVFLVILLTDVTDAAIADAATIPLEDIHEIVAARALPAALDDASRPRVRART